jgi:hypothetical protein
MYAFVNKNGLNNIQLLVFQYIRVTKEEVNL